MFTTIKTIHSSSANYCATSQPPSLAGPLAGPRSPPPNLLHVLLPQLAHDTRAHQSAELLSIIRGEMKTPPECDLSRSKRAREVLLSIIKGMSHDGATEASQTPVLTRDAVAGAMGDRGKSSMIPAASLKQQKRKVMSNRRLSQCPAEHNAVDVKDSITPPNGLIKGGRLAGAAGKHPPQGLQDDEQFSEYSASTTARDTGSISLDTISSSEPTTSRLPPSPPTAFAVPLFMRSPDPLCVPIPSFPNTAA
eukprot:Blabericola_migrator_1__5644@NODE_2868_length_2262_cov_219_481549_g243_i1_p1_GENE_NODE_2868_length_2262_cov_219_481549_g243_i1NODE_2868_length_2262_cov_219_481549_g243_i1_p1_ORF_typecomplete_len250_score19_05_NODE_2868_length_2262_cov_219_481549_g243_i112031952